jgi:Rhodanese-like domain
MRVRRITLPLLAVLAALLLPAATRPGRAQQPSIELIKVEQLNALLRKSSSVQIVDVRSRQEYLTRHIKGALSIPLDTIELRAGEIPRQGLVVLY